ncbi:TolC family protein [Thermodesulfobacteriota bacterium]
MKVKLSVKTVSYKILLIIIAIVFSTGCSHLKGNDDYNNLFVSQETLWQIEPIKLEKSKEEKKVFSPDMDEPGPVELEISLEECRALTLENNLDLKVQLINPAIAAESVSEAEANKFEAVFTVNAVYQEMNTPVAGYADQISGSKIDQSYVRYGVSKNLKTGGDISFGIVDTRTKTDAINSTYNPRYTPSFTASISQPLLRDAGTRASTHSIRAIEYDSQMNDAQTKMEAIRIIAEVDRAYWRLYAEKRSLDVSRQEYNLAKDLSEQTRRLVEVGMKPEIELIWANAREAESLQAIISAENRVLDMERDLKLRLNKPGLGVNTETKLILSTEPDTVRYEFNKEQIVEKATENRMDMLMLELGLAKDEITIEYRRNQLHPSVELQYDYTINSLGDSRRDSYDTLYENQYNDQTVTLSVSIPLGNEAQKSSLRRAEHEMAQRLYNKDRKKSQIEYEVFADIDQLESGWQSIVASRKTAMYMDKQYEAEKRRYELGMQTLRDVLLAQKALAEARRNEITTLTNYQIDLIDLAYSTGTLLGAAKVELEPFVPKQ